MEVMTLRGIVENGQICLTDSVRLPEKAVVYVVVPGLETLPGVRIGSPRLVHPEQAADFVKVVEEIRDAGVR
jgi:tetratricopeptide (TPR) repeat protein